MGKLVRRATGDRTNKHADRGGRVRRDVSALLDTDVRSRQKRFNWHRFPTRMCLFRNHTRCVSVLLHLWQPLVLVTTLITVMSPLQLCVCVLDNANAAALTLAHHAAVSGNHYCVSRSMRCFWVEGGVRVCKRVNVGQRKHGSTSVPQLSMQTMALFVVHTPPTVDSVRLQLRRGISSRISCRSHLAPPQVQLNTFRFCSFAKWKQYGSNHWRRRAALPAAACYEKPGGLKLGDMLCSQEWKMRSRGRS